MSTFKYADESIQSHDIMIAIPSMVIAVSILNFPSTLAGSTRYADGWLAVILGGLIAVFFTWVVAKLASKYPHQSFLSYASSLVTKPVAYVLTLLFAIQGVMLTAYEVSAISFISSLYLLEETPVEIIALSFLLVVVYAVSGSRVGVFRINTMVLPIIFFTTGLLIFISIGYMRVENVLPVFTTDINGYVKGIMDSSLPYVGIEILFFYIALVKQPKKVAGKAAFGMTWAVGLYFFIYLTCIAVFGQPATEVIRLPFIELAKSAELPGGFFERMESVFFVIWITAIFTTAMMAFDMAVMALQTMLPNLKKMTIILTLSPLIFLIGMLPNDFLEHIKFGEYLGYFSWGLIGVVTILLWIMYGIKGGQGRGK